MKNINRNRALPLALVLAAAGFAQVASALNYRDSDLLLVFRKDGFNDVEFNLGSVTNYLGRANGTTNAVTGWDLNLVRANYNNNLSGVKFILVAATSVDDGRVRVWSTDAIINASVAPTDMPGSRWSQLRAKIATVGGMAAASTATNATQFYVVTPSDSSSYTGIASDNGTTDPATISGLAPFAVETTNMGTSLFYELKPSSANPKPPAALIGYFTWTAAGVLNFTAGPLQQTQVPLVAPRILSITRSDALTTVRFSTTNSLNYRLWFLNQLKSPWAWSSNAALVAGDGTPKTLTDSYSGGNQRYYKVEVLR